MLNLFKKEKNKNSSRDIADIRRKTIETLYPIIDVYADWYAEHGITLPEEFAQDPTTWTNILRKIQRAFDLSANGNLPGGEIDKVRKVNRDDLVRIKEEEVQEGFELFGKYLQVLIDPRYE